MVDQIHKFVDEPHFADYADPFLYNERLTMVKYIVSGTLDYFWSPDDSWSFFDQLKGTNYMRLLPNSGITIIKKVIFNYLIYDILRTFNSWRRYFQSTLLIWNSTTFYRG